MDSRDRLVVLHYVEGIQLAGPTPAIESIEPPGGPHTTSRGAVRLWAWRFCTPSAPLLEHEVAIEETSKTFTACADHCRKWSVQALDEERRWLDECGPTAARTELRKRQLFPAGHLS